MAVNRCSAARRVFLGICTSLALLAPLCSAAAPSARPSRAEVDQLRSRAFTQRGDFWYLQCSGSGPWIQYSFFAIRGLAASLKPQHLDADDATQHVSQRYDVTLSGRPALYYFTRDHRWLDFGEPLSLTYHAALKDGAWSFTLDENDTHLCGIGETQRKPELGAIPAPSEPLRSR